MSILMRDAGILNTPQGSSGVPTQSISLVNASNQFMSMSDANFGVYNKAKFAVSTWIKKTTASGLAFGIMCQMGAAGQRAFTISINASDKINIRTYVDGTNIDGELLTTATYTATTYYHILFWYDSANATAGDRMRLWVNGVEVTAFDVDTNPSAAIFDSTSNVAVGASSSAGASAADGLIYQHTFVSGSLPTIGQVYNAGAPLSITGLTGLFSVLDVAGGAVTHDGVLATAWTNNNTATASSTIP